MLLYHFFELRFSPNHFVHYTHVALDDADNLGADVLINIVGNRDAMMAVFDEFYCDVNTLQQAFGVDATQDKTPFI